MQRHEQRRRPLVAVSAGLDGMKLDFNPKPGRRDGKPTGTTAPILCAVSDMNEVQALLTDACRNVLLDVGQAIERHKKTISEDAAA